jgi:hypothetical protein
MARTKSTPSLDDASHRQENHEAPISASSFETPLVRLLRMRERTTYDTAAMQFEAQCHAQASPVQPLTRQPSSVTDLHYGFNFAV